MTAAAVAPVARMRPDVSRKISLLMNLLDLLKGRRTTVLTGAAGFSLVGALALGTFTPATPGAAPADRPMAAATQVQAAPTALPQTATPAPVRQQAAAQSPAPASPTPQRPAERVLFTSTTTASYYWGDRPTASGKYMHKGMAASPSWPLGTEGYVIYNGKRADFHIGDRGPGVPSSYGIMLDLDGYTFAELTGGTFDPASGLVKGNGGKGHIKVRYVITKWGEGKGRKGEPVPYAEKAYLE